MLATTQVCTYSATMSTKSPSADGNIRPDGIQYPMVRTEDEWRSQLSKQEYHILRNAGTEPPFSGEYTENKAEGIYSCRACGHELFASSTKFDSHCGWPSFFTALAGDTVVYLEDRSMGSTRTEVRCASCGGHLGHVFKGEGYATPTDLRFCINSISMSFSPSP